MKHFAMSESGAVTVDWVVLTAALVGLGLATMSVVTSGVQDLSGDVDDQLQTNMITTSFGVDFRELYIANILAGSQGYTAETAANLVDANMAQWAEYGPKLLENEIKNTQSFLDANAELDQVVAEWSAGGGDNWDFLHEKTSTAPWLTQEQWIAQKSEQFGTQQAYVDYLQDTVVLYEEKAKHLETLK